MTPLLQDTHVFVWAQADRRRLPPQRRPGQDRSPRFGVGLRGGRLPSDGRDVLGIEIGHVAEVATLPAHHRDPFVRMLVAQARVVGCPLMSFDGALDRYDVDRWAP